MENKKLFSAPQIEVIHFDSKDVITDGSNTGYTSDNVYNITNIKDFFNISA